VFYVLSKILDVALTPLAWATVLILAGVLGWGSPWRRRAFPALGITLLLVFSLEPVSNALFRSLENPPLRTFRRDATYDVAILLGGVGDDRVEATWGERAFNDSSERLLETFDLLRAGTVKNAIISGGAPSETRMKMLEARVLGDQLIAWGIAPERLIIEDQARNTHENAVYSAAIARERGWTQALVVTSAFHMPRAYGCFRAEMFAVDTMPVDFRSYASPYRGDVIPRAHYLNDSSEAIREWFGRAIYRVRGYSR
jgi:uncharacterized SAM-binding protein YcdF (DUF218 family)